MSDLPIPDKNTFIGEFEEMDLSSLKDHQYGVAVSLGKRDTIQYACSTLMAPLDFYEMVEAVATIWQEEQAHAKAFILKKDRKSIPEILDECTIDFIEAKYLDILADMLLEDNKEYTCKANVIEAKTNDEPDTTEQDPSP